MKLRIVPALVLLAVASSADANPPAPELPREAAPIETLLLFDASATQVLAQRNARAPFLPASMTKVMSAFVAFELIKQNKLSLEQHFTVRSATAERWSGRGSSMYLEAGERISVDDLLHGIATASANDAAMVLATGYAGSVSAWTKLMNREASRIGMRNSHFATPSGWPDGGKTIVTATDLITLANALIGRHPELYSRYFGKKQMVWNRRELFSRNPLIGTLEGADGIKTGYTREAGYNFLGSVRRGGRRLLVVVGGANSESQRSAASRALIEWGFGYWKNRTLFERGDIVGTAQVQDGEKRIVRLRAPRDLIIANYQPDAHLTASLHYLGPLRAPVRKGQTVATLIVASSNGLRSEFPLIAAASVEQASLLDRLLNGFMSLFS